MTPQEVDELIQNGSPREQALLLYSEHGMRPLAINKRVTTKEQLIALAMIERDDTTGAFQEIAQCYFGFMYSYQGMQAYRLSLGFSCESLAQLLDVSLTGEQYCEAMNKALGCIEDKRTRNKALRAIEGSFKGSSSRAFRKEKLPAPIIEAEGVKFDYLSPISLGTHLQVINSQTKVFRESLYRLRYFLRYKAPIESCKTFIGRQEAYTRRNLKRLSYKLGLAYPEGLPIGLQLMPLSSFKVKYNPQYTQAIYKRGAGA